MDETTEFQSNLKKIYSSLPESIKDVIVAPETTDVYNSIQNEFQLSKQQREDLSIQTGFLLLGLRDPQDLVTALETNLGIPREASSLIAQELNREIFYSIKDELKEIHSWNISSPTPNQPAITTPPSETHSPSFSPPAQQSSAKTQETTSKSQTPPSIEPNKTPSFSFAKAVGSQPQPLPSKTIGVSPLPPAPPSVPEPSLVTKTPMMNLSTPEKQTPPQEGPKAHVGNIFEEKLGGAFRVQSDAVRYSTTEVAQAPQPNIPRVIPPVPPPPPQSIAPETPKPTNTPTQHQTPPPSAPPAPTQKAADPYRELPM